MSTTPNPAPRFETEWLDGTPFWDRGITVLDLVVLLASQRRLILKTVLVAGLLTGIYLYRTPTMYQSTVVLQIPPRMGNRPTGGSIKDLAYASSTDQVLTSAGADDYWDTAMGKPELLDRVVKSQGLLAEYGTTSYSFAEFILRLNTSLAEERAGTVSISVLDTKPARAAAIANGYVAAVQDILAEDVARDVRERTAFFTPLLERERGAALAAERNLVELQRKSGIVSMGAQEGEALGQIAGLRGQVSALTIELQSLAAADAGNNPEMVRVRAQLAAVQRQLALAEQQHGVNGMGDFAANELPASEVAYAHATGDVQYHESLLATFGLQLQSARMDAQRSAPRLFVVEPAIPADRPANWSWPVVLLVGLFAGTIVGCALALVRQFYRNYKATPKGRERLHNLSVSWKTAAAQKTSR